MLEAYVILRADISLQADETLSVEGPDQAFGYMISGPQSRIEEILSWLTKHRASSYQIVL